MRVVPHRHTLCLGGDPGRKERGFVKVLVVDDNQPLAGIMKEILEGDGFEVMSAKDGIDGYSAYLLFRPDIIITDIQMPRENGLEMMGRIRTHDPMIRAIYISGDMRAFRSLLKEEQKRYPVRFFEKPFLVQSLKGMVLEPNAPHSTAEYIYA
jgi:CheY-like chemotaxis protein